MSSDQTARLTALLHHRWAALVVAELHAGTSGGRFAALARRLRVGRPVLTKTLDSLRKQGIARRNPGYGHPLRPEYVLTAKGAELGAWCARLTGTIRRAGLEEVALKKWSLPVLLEIHLGHERFSELKESLPGITARALTLALKELGEAGVIRRVVEDSYPPRVRYRVLPRARRLAKLLEDLP